MFLQRLFCCGGCSGNSQSFQTQSITSQQDLTGPTDTIINRVSHYKGQIKMGDIVKFNEDDNFPSLEVYVELENEKI